MFLKHRGWPLPIKLKLLDVHEAHLTRPRLPSTHTPTGVPSCAPLKLVSPLQTYRALRSFSTLTLDK